MARERERQFFREMQVKVDAAWRESQIYRRNPSWGYHLSALPFQREVNALVGLNWGAKNSSHYGPQLREPEYSEATIGTWDFVGDYLPLINKYLGEVRAGSMNYFNFSPFRSPGMDEMERADWRTSADNFFLDTLDFLEPPMTLIVGSSVLGFLGRQATKREVSVPGNPMRGYVGTIVGKARRPHPFYAVPHPAYVRRQLGRQVPVATRMADLWRAVFAGSTVGKG